jgi:hypothetical protein
MRRFATSLSVVPLAVVLACGTTSGGKHRAGFADTVYAGDVFVGGAVACQTKVLASMPVRVDEPVRLFTLGQGFFHQNAGSLHTATLHVQLRDATSVVAVGNVGLIGVSGNNDANASVSGVLFGGTDPFAVGNGSGSPFVATAGDYTMELVFTPGSTPCPYQSDMIWNSLSYVLASP